MTMALQQAGVVPLGRILRAAEVGLYRDAEGALRAAKAAAAAQRAAALAELEAECAARREAAAQETAREQARSLAETEAAIQRELAALHREIAEAIAEGVARVIGGLDLAEAVARAAQRAVAELSTRHAVTVRVNPLAHDRTASRLASRGATVRVIADATLPPDGCIIETPAGFVRAGINEQLDAIRAALTTAAEGNNA